ALPWHDAQWSAKWARDSAQTSGEKATGFTAFRARDGTLQRWSARMTRRSTGVGIVRALNPLALTSQYTAPPKNSTTAMRAERANRAMRVPPAVACSPLVLLCAAG